jgi:DNA-binding NarL/FixJ family response regulator
VTRAEMRQPDILVVAASARRREAIVDLIHRSTRYGRAAVSTSSTFATHTAEITIADLETLAAADSFLQVARNAPGTASFIALIDSQPATWIRHALRGGINAVLSRELTSDELELAIEAAEQGFVVLPALVAQTLMSTLSQTLEFSDLVEQLTSREREVLDLMSAGLSNRQIAMQLGISEHTAKFHISSVLGKLGASSRTQAVTRGIRTGLIAL